MQQTTNNNKTPRLTALQLALATAGLLGVASAANAQSSVGQVQDVVVTTGVRGEARTVADSPAPIDVISGEQLIHTCLLYTSPSPRDRQKSRMPSSA